MLETDTVCWHCGWRIPQTETQKPAPKPTRQQEETPKEISLSAIGVYGGITAVVVVLMFMVMNVLGRKPFVVISPESGRDWQVITDANQSYTFDLPPGWVWVEGRIDGTVTEMVEGEMKTAVFATLQDLTEDAELLGLAVSNNPERPAVFMVGRSQGLYSNTMVDLVERQRNTAVSETIVIENLLGNPQAHWLLELPGTPPWKCQQDVVRGQNVNYLVTICAPNPRYAPQLKQLEGILHSFQPLFN